MPDAPCDPETFLDRSLSDFLVELARQKRIVTAGEWNRGSAAEEDDQKGRAMNSTWRALARHFRKKEEEAKSHGIGALYEKARYPMLALADQTFLHDIEWPGQADWNVRCLEAEFTGRGVAGIEFFRKARECLDRGGPDGDVLCKIYFYALKFGFRGQFPAGSQEIADLQRELRARLERKGRDARLCDQAYAHTIPGDRTKLIPSIWKTAVAAAVVATALVVLFAAALLLARGDLSTPLSEIETKISQSRPGPSAPAGRPEQPPAKP